MRQPQALGLRTQPPHAADYSQSQCPLISYHSIPENSRSWRAEPDAEVAVLDAVDMDGVGAEWGDDLQLVSAAPYDNYKTTATKSSVVSLGATIARLHLHNTGLRLLRWARQKAFAAHWYTQMVKAVLVSRRLGCESHAGTQEDGGDGVAAEDRNGVGDEGEGEEGEEDEEGGWEMEVRGRSVAVYARRAAESVRRPWPDDHGRAAQSPALFVPWRHPRIRQLGLLPAMDTSVFQSACCRCMMSSGWSTSCQMWQHWGTGDLATADGGECFRPRRTSTCRRHPGWRRRPRQRRCSRRRRRACRRRRGG